MNLFALCAKSGRRSAQIGTARGSLHRQKLLDRHSDVPTNLAQQRRGDVLALMKRYSRPPAVRVTELLVGTALPDFDEAECDQPLDDFARLQDRHTPHGYATSMRCVPTNSDSIRGSPSSRS